MPSPFSCEQYAAIAKPVLNLRKFLTLPGEPDSTVQAQVLEVKQVYQTTISSLDLDGLDARLRPLVTEIHRLVRLLETQGMFLKLARTEAAIAHRQQQCLEQVNQLIALLEPFDPSRP